MTATTITRPRVDALHALGTNFSKPLHAQAALEASGLANWNVRKIDLTAHEGDITLDVPNRWATVFDNPDTGTLGYLGVVGGSYQPIQNEEHVALLDSIVDESGANFESAGAMNRGRLTYVTMKMPSQMLVGGEDAIDQYLIGFNSHDGTSSFRFVISPVRVICANMLHSALKNAKSSFSVRHTNGATGAIQGAREALSLTFKYLDEFQIEADRMIDKSLTDATFSKMVKSLFNIDEAKSVRATNTAQQHIDGVLSIWNSNSPTMTNVKGTRWGGYQAITEYVDHFMPVRGTGDEQTLRAQRSVVSKPIERLKTQSFAMMSKGA